MPIQRYKSMHAHLHRYIHMKIKIAAKTAQLPIILYYSVNHVYLKKKKMSTMFCEHLEGIQKLKDNEVTQLL